MLRLGTCLPQNFGHPTVSLRTRGLPAYLRHPKERMRFERMAQESSVETACGSVLAQEILFCLPSLTGGCGTVDSQFVCDCIRFHAKLVCTSNLRRILVFVNCECACTLNNQDSVSL